MWVEKRCFSWPYLAEPQAFWTSCWSLMFVDGFISHTIHGTDIFTYIWLIFVVNVGKYASPMDCLGMVFWGLLKTLWGLLPWG